MMLKICANRNCSLLLPSIYRQPLTKTKMLPLMGPSWTSELVILYWIVLKAKDSIFSLMSLSPRQALPVQVIWLALLQKFTNACRPSRFNCIALQYCSRNKFAIDCTLMIQILQVEAQFSNKIYTPQTHFYTPVTQPSIIKTGHPSVIIPSCLLPSPLALCLPDSGIIRILLMIKFLLMVNKQGQTRLAKYYNEMTVKQRTTLQGELVRKCLSRNETLCSFIEYRGYKVIYRRYASLYFIMGLDLEEENEMAYLEFIHNLVETMDKYFENVCELDIMYNIEKAHYILDEMIMNGQIVETNKTLILAPLYVLDKLQE